MRVALYVSSPADSVRRAERDEKQQEVARNAANVSYGVGS
jgi:hypothetical protein